MNSLLLALTCAFAFQAPNPPTDSKSSAVVAPVAAAPGSVAEESIALEIYDLRDLLALEEIDMLGTTPEARAEKQRRAGEVLRSHLERYIARLPDPVDRAVTAKLAGTSALVLRAGRSVQDYAKQILERAARERHGHACPIACVFTFEVDAAKFAWLGIADEDVVLVTDLEACRKFSREWNGPPELRANEVSPITSLSTSLAPFLERGSIEPEAQRPLRYTTGYDVVEHVEPGDRTLVVPRIETIELGHRQRISAVPLPGTAYELSLALDITRIEGRREETTEHGPVMHPDTQDFHFESRVILEPGNWLFATVERGDVRKMVAVWLSPVVDGRATTEYPK